MIWPAPNYGYLNEQAALFLCAIAALLMLRLSVALAVVFYCVIALVPVLAMMNYHQAHGGEFSVLANVPLVGVFFVATLTQSVGATVIYGLVALAANCAIGLIYDDMGRAGALCILTAMVFVSWCWRRKSQTDKALEQLGIIQRGLANIIGSQKDE
jgi:hypothetical protein